MHVFFFFVALTIYVHQITASDDTSLKDECERYMDHLFQNVLENQQDRIDPRNLKDRKISFQVGVLLFKYSIEGKLHDGVVEGMSGGKRTGRCVVTKKETENIFEARFTFRNVRLRYKASLISESSIIFGTKSVTMSVNGRSVTLTLAIQVAVPKDGGPGEVRRVGIASMGDVTVSVEEKFSFFDLILSPFKAAMVTAFSGEFRNFIYGDFKDICQEEASLLDYPQ